MKTLWLLLLLGFPSCQPPAPLESDALPKPDYIVITHTGKGIMGVEDHYIRPLIISTRHQAVLPECGDWDKLDPSLTAPQREAANYMGCEIIITDSSTYQSVQDFVQQNPSYFSTRVNKAKANEFQLLQYSITISGREYGIYLTNAQFFVLLSSHLQAHKGDKALIERLRNRVGEAM